MTMYRENKLGTGSYIHFHSFVQCFCTVHYTSTSVILLLLFQTSCCLRSISLRNTIHLYIWHMKTRKVLAFARHCLREVESQGRKDEVSLTAMTELGCPFVSWVVNTKHWILYYLWYDSRSIWSRMRPRISKQRGCIVPSSLHIYYNNGHNNKDLNCL